MSAATHATSQQNSGMQDYLVEMTSKLMALSLSQLKKRAKKTGISDNEIKMAAAAEDEDDAKGVLISLIVKTICLKAAPTPTRAPVALTEEDLAAQTCKLCAGCIRPPGHHGPCMDGQCNDIFPEKPKDQKTPTVAEEIASFQVVKQNTENKVQEKVAAEEARRKAADEARKKVAKEARQKAEEEALRKAREEEALRKAADEARKKAAEEARHKAEEEEARRKALEEEARRRAVAEEARQKMKEAEAEALRKRAALEAQMMMAAAAAEEARKKAAEEEAAEEEALRAKRQAEEEAEMAEMDQRCVDTFLECVRPVSWRERIRTPLKGTILYTKFIRPARPMGTSVDVKDSSFKSLGNFLNFLESEGLLRLKPGLTDPVVTDIRLDACSKYRYTPRPKPSKIVESTATPLLPR